MIDLASYLYDYGTYLEKFGIKDPNFPLSIKVFNQMQENL